MNPQLQLKTMTLLSFIIFVVTSLALSPAALALNPPPDGGYPGNNTAEGDNALLHVNTAVGINNTAVGANALRDDTSGYYNVAVGSGALANNTTGNFNMAIGTEALTNNNANFNLAIGFRVGYSNTTGHHLTGIGAAALRNNTTGASNTAIGADALRENTTGDLNTAGGAQTLYNDTTGAQNTAYGFAALFGNTTGSGNLGLGFAALQNNTTGNQNISIGYFSGANITSAGGVICIGSAGANVNNSCYIGNIYSNVQPIVGTNPDYVTISSSGRLGRGNVSSRRYKHDIKPMNNASEALYALTPVSFRYNKEYDATQTPAFGLIAEDVAEVYPDLVGRNPEGQPESVRYDQVNAMLLNEFLKEHRKVDQQQAAISELKSLVQQQKKEFQAAIAEQRQQFEARLKEQDAKIQKVNARIELNKGASQTVANSE